MKKTDFTIIYMLLLFIASNTSEGTWLKTLFGMLTILCGALYVYQLIKGENKR
jgi:Ca2+/Na+ antiporter